MPPVARPNRLLYVLAGVLLSASGILGAEVYQTNLRVTQAPTRYWDANLITSTHESIHWVNSQLRNRYGRPCFYLGSGKFVCLKNEPRTTLATVARQVEFRGGVYDLYLVRQQTPMAAGMGDWNQQPSYLMDEWSAYLGASRVALRQDPSCWSEILYALELAYYSHLIPESREVWEHLAIETLAVADQANREKRCYSVRQENWREWLRRELNGTPHPRAAPVYQQRIPHVSEVVPQFRVQGGST